MDIRYSKDKKSCSLFIDNQEAAKISAGGGFELQVTYKKIRGKSLTGALDKVVDMMPMGRWGMSMGSSPIWSSSFALLGKKSLTDEEIEKIFSVVENELNESIKENIKNYIQLNESTSKDIIGEIKEIYKHAEDFSETIAEGIINISFTLSGTGTSFEEVKGDMDNIADAYNLIVTDFSSFCDEGQDIECDEYLRTGQPVEFCISFEYLEKPLHESEKLYGTYEWTAEKCADWVKSHMYRVYHARGFKSVFNILKKAVTDDYEKFGDDTLISCSDDELMDIANIIYNRQRNLPPSAFRKL